MPIESLKTQTKRGLFWNAFDTFSNTGMQFVVGIVMARLLTPEDYGITALPAVFLAIASTFIDGSFGLALIRKPEVTEKDLSTSFFYSLAMGLFMYLCLFVGAPFIAEFYNTPVLTPLTRITALTFLWGPLATPQSIILRRNLNFKTPARISLISNFIAAIVGISTAYMGYGLWSLVASTITSSLMYIIQIWIAVKWLPRTGWSLDSFRYLWGFGNKMIATNILNTLHANIAPVIIGKYYSPSQLGLYNRAQGFSILPVQQLTSILRTVSFPVLSKLQDDKELMAFHYRRMIRTACFVSFPLLMLIAALSKPLILLLLTEKWESCVLLLQILCFSTMWGPMSSLNLNVLQVMGRTDLYFNLEINKKIVGSIFMLVSLPFGLEWFCLSSVFCQLYCVYVNIRSANKVLPLGITAQYKDVLSSFLLSLIMFIITYAFTLYFDNPWFLLIFGSILGLLIYVGLSFIFKTEAIGDVIYLINGKTECYGSKNI